MNVNIVNVNIVNVNIVNVNIVNVNNACYGVATISRVDKIIGLFCKRGL